MRKLGGLAVMAFALSLAATATTPAHATIWIHSDSGGRIEDYLSKYRNARASNERVVIDGACLSACTLVLGIVPRNRVCATQNATLGFHAAFEADERGHTVASPRWTQVVLSNLPGSIRSWIARRGGLRSEMLYLRGQELAQYVPACAA
jgi:hypothetical protein